MNLKVRRATLGCVFLSTVAKTPVVVTALTRVNEDLLVNIGMRLLGYFEVESTLTCLKALMPITFSSPRTQPEVVYFLVSNESPYFSNCRSEISPSNSL